MTQRLTSGPGDAYAHVNRCQRTDKRQQGFAAGCRPGRKLVSSPRRKDRSSLQQSSRRLRIPDVSLWMFGRSHYATTSMPMFRALPLMMEMALSMLPLQFRSGILMVAISSTCAAVTFPTFTFCPLAEPALMPARSFSRKEAGGVFSSREKLLSYACGRQVACKRENRRR